MDNKPSVKLPHIVVLGAGFGGLAFARKFPDGAAMLTVVDRTNHHLFQPLLYQVAAAGLAVPNIAQPVRSLLNNRRNTHVLMDEVEVIDLEKKQVHLRGTTLDFDHLIMAMGGKTSYFGHPEWEQHAAGLKTIEDAIRIRREVLGNFEKAEMTEDPEERRRLTTIVVIGGGPTGVELAGTFAELQKRVLARDFRRVSFESARVILIEAGDRLLDAFPRDLSEKARIQLEGLGVDLRLGSRVEDIRAGEVITANTTIRAANILWGAGVRAVPLAGSLGMDTDRTGRVRVNPDLSLPGHRGVFAIGDMVTLVDAKGQAVPGMAPAAMQMGAYVAKILAREINSGTTGRPPFVYRNKGMMATIGRSRAVAVTGRLKFSGTTAWLAWLFVHLIFLVGFRNKISVMFEWIYSYFTYKRGARVIYGFEGDSSRKNRSAEASSKRILLTRP